MRATVYSIFFHNYYGHHQKWLQFFTDKMSVPFNLFYNIVGDSIYNSEEVLRHIGDLRKNTQGQYINKIIFRRSPNKGKDIGGKLVLLDAYLHLTQESEFMIFLHDKKSPYKIQTQEWQQKLFRIIEPAFIERAITFFNENPKVGIIAGADSIRDEYDHANKSFISHNQVQLTQLRSEFGINTTDYRYVAGTMFWARAVPLLTFFRKHAPLDIRKKLEAGNVMDENKGTNTHAWERILSWIVSDQGYTIKGL